MIGALASFLNGPNEINWYNYEKIVYLNETSCLDYLKYIQSSSNSSSSSSSSSPESITIESNIQRKESIELYWQYYLIL